MKFNWQKNKMDLNIWKMTNYPPSPDMFEQMDFLIQRKNENILASILPTVFCLINWFS